MRRVTINDVAERAGVSKSTVSHVINKTRFVTEETRDRVLKAVDDLEYRPSVIARSLVSQRTKTAGLLISDVGNPFYNDVIIGVEDMAFSHDYSVFLCNTGYDSARGLKLIRSLIDKSVDGIMFMTSSMAIEMVHEVIDNRIEAVVLDWGVPNIEDLARTITINFDTGMHQAVKHLRDLGHRRIAFIGGPSSLWTVQVRKDTFYNNLNRLGLQADDASYIEGNLRIEGGNHAFEELKKINPRPTAVIAANDLTALGFLWTASKEGVRIPKELSIIGLDDIDLVSKISPPLTTIGLPRREIGCLAMQILLDAIDERTEIKCKHEVESRLVIRDSTAPVSVN
jgi:DNA-binding LacI/PurR family transcriptional regulator